MQRFESPSKLSLRVVWCHYESVLPAAADVAIRTNEPLPVPLNLSMCPRPLHDEILGGASWLWVHYRLMFEILCLSMLHLGSLNELILLLPATLYRVCSDSALSGASTVLRWPSLTKRTVSWSSAYSKLGVDVVP